MTQIYSNAIEGNTLTFQETELVINRGMTIGNKSLKEHFEALNHKDGIKFLYDFIKKRQELDEDIILEIHKIILKNISDMDVANAVGSGHYRNANVMIKGPTGPLGAVHLYRTLRGTFIINLFKCI
ncbi:hypothetical protein AGMMS49928_26220 [Spirochaetia bacterium]|nr:hypothetical protein AGMMS49928_26220 [Spirochaetia bacterium]